jgi:hypothetical protein
MSTLAVATDWGFDPIYSLKTQARLEDSLSAVFSQWILDTYPKLAEFLTRHPDQKSTLAIHSARTGLKVKGVFVWFLLILIVVPSGPSQCVFFIGPQDWIEQKKAGVQAQLEEQLKAPGVKATIVQDPTS